MRHVSNKSNVGKKIERAMKRCFDLARSNEELHRRVIVALKDLQRRKVIKDMALIMRQKDDDPNAELELRRVETFSVHGNDTKRHSVIFGSVSVTRR